MRDIVVGHDGSDAADQALDWAWAQAARRGLPLTVVRAYDMDVVLAWSPVPPTEEDAARAAERQQALVDEAVAKAQARAGSVAVEVSARTALGRPSVALAELTDSSAMLVVGRRGAGGVRRLALGSTSSAVLRRARCPVVVVPSDWQQPHPESGTPAAGHGPRVVVGWDGSAGADSALRWAATTAVANDLLLEVVFAWTITSLHPRVAGEITWVPPLSDYEAVAGTELERALATAREAAPDVRAEGTAVRMASSKALLDAARGADLLVVGSRGHGGFQGLVLGSTSEQVSRHATCPVAVVHEDEERLDAAG